MELTLLALGWLAPWALGMGLVAALLRKADNITDAGELTWTMGSGWFVGALLLTLWMRAISLVGIKFGVVAIGAPLMVLAALLLGIVWRHRKDYWATLLRGAWRSLAGADVAGWRRGAWLVLLAWFALRFTLLMGEIVWRPLYPWDAWTQWATKARVWYELKSMVPFVSVAEWLQANGNAYFDAAPHYPATVPLWQVWSCLLLGRWDDSLMNVPWWCTGGALSLAIFGFLRRIDLEPLPALVATLLVTAAPILNVHIALAGYADLPMAGYLTLSALAGYLCIRSRSPHDLVPALLFAAALPLIKNPGRIWLPLLLPGIVVAIAPRRGLRIVAGAFAAAAAAFLVLAQTNPVVLGYQLHLAFDLPWRGLLDAYFNYANWHLLWYAVVAAVILGRKVLFSPEVAPLTVVIGGGLLFLLFGFAFTNARVWVDDQSTVNRATLHLAPLLFIWVIVVFRAWANAMRDEEAMIAAGRT
jgi:hypothetical protein